MKFGFLETERAEVSSPMEAAEMRGLDDELRRVCVTHLEKLGLSRLARKVRVEWNGRMRSSAGRASWPTGLVQLNPRLAQISAAEVRRTLLHELAHLVAYERNPRRRIHAHGAEWQEACAELGIPGEKATHRLNLPTRQIARKWRYQCSACGNAIERVRRIRRAVACYHCCASGRYDDRFRLVESQI